MEEHLGKEVIQRQVSQRKESVKQLEPPSKFEMETSFGDKRERLTSKSESIKEENEKGMIEVKNNILIFKKVEVPIPKSALSDKPDFPP